MAVPLQPEAERDEGGRCDRSLVHHILVHEHPRESTGVQTALVEMNLENVKTPVVCIIVNGGVEVLRHACHALENRMPVIVLQGTGGVAGLFESLGKGISSKAAMRRLMTEWVDKDTVKDDDVDTMFRLVTDGNQRTVVFWNIRQQHLDAVILKSLIKNEKYEIAKGFITTMLKKKVDVPADKEERHSIVESVECIKLLQECKRACDRGSDSRQKVWEVMDEYVRNIRFHHLLKIYASTSTTGDATGKEMYKKLRENLHQFTSDLVTTPLECSGFRKCQKCQDGLKGEEETCLPPAVEIFLLAVMQMEQELTETILEHVEGKMAAAMFTSAVYNGMAREANDGLKKQDYLQKANHFKNLASRTFQNCCRHDRQNKEKTQHLLEKRYDNVWGSYTILQIAIITGNDDFMKEDVTQAYLHKEWARIPENESKSLRLFPPLTAYFVSLVTQVVFLVMFSNVLLFHPLTSFSPSLVVMTVFIADLFVDEIRQVLMGDPLLRSLHAKRKRNKLTEYVSNGWNWVDLAGIFTFPLALCLIFYGSDNPLMNNVGRVLLSFDLLCFFLRFLQMLLYFENVGIFLVMVKESVKQVLYFTVIQLIVMFGYLVSTHGMMFPPPNNTTGTWAYMLDLPFKGYWQAFNNFDRQDIAVCQSVVGHELEDGDCKSESILATQYGHYFSSVLLAAYLMFVNILMMNLLIAKFNFTFEVINENARMHQSWHMYMLLMEYQVHTPAPFSCLSLIMFPILHFRQKYCAKEEDYHDNGGTQPQVAAQSDETVPQDNFELQELRMASDSLKEEGKGDVGRMQEQGKDLKKNLEDVQKDLKQMHEAMEEKIKGVQEELQGALQEVLRLLHARESVDKDSTTAEQPAA